MTAVFGTKEVGAVYVERPTAYVIPVKDGCFAATNTPKGYFLLGGGIDEGETDAICVNRECIEEVGFGAVLFELITEAEFYCDHSWKNGNLYHMTARFYTGELTESDETSVEEDTELVWLKLTETDKLRPPHQRYAAGLLAKRLAAHTGDFAQRLKGEMTEKRDTKE